MASLFRLLNMADRVTLDGSPCENLGVWTDGVWRLCVNGEDVMFADQVVVMDIFDQQPMDPVAEMLDDDAEPEEVPRKFKLGLFMLQPLSQADWENC